jgi:predicted nucleic acid-binding protein
MSGVAYLDTTILAELCLKKSLEAVRIREVLDEYSERQISAYVLKEFRGGVLNNLVSYCNLLMEAESLAEVFPILGKLEQGGFQSYRRKIAEQVTARITRTFPRDLSLELALNRLVDELSDLICDAWDDAREMGTLIETLLCFDGQGPRYNEARGRFEMPTCWGAPPSCGCCVALRAQQTNILATAITSLRDGSKRETRKQVEALEVAQSDPASSTRHHCRGFGDFAVVLFAPEKADVLSTNSADFPALCRVFAKPFRNPLDGSPA